ncbi:MAG: hypothetical protein ACD_23C00826G0001 [uncultured bacterium]|nr:MAG: hypothetical protein ACD_23C00826G0001 [uncultured bacterium]
MLLQKHVKFLRYRPLDQIARPVAQHFRERINRFVFLAKPNYRILLHGGVTPSWLLKTTLTIAFQQVTPPSSTHVRTQDSVIARFQVQDK